MDELIKVLSISAATAAIGLGIVYFVGAGETKTLTEIRHKCKYSGNDWAVIYGKNAAPKYFICLPHQSPVHIFEGEEDNFIP